MARQLSLVAYLLASGGREKDEASIRENVPVYGHTYEASLGVELDHERGKDALRKQLARDVEALAGAGIAIEVRGERERRRYRLPAAGFSPGEVDLTAEERAVLTGALRALSHDFPYAGPLRLAVANLIGAVSSSPNGEEDESLFAAAVSASHDEAVYGRVARLESAVARRKRVRFPYYSISRDETAEREFEPYALSILGGNWYVTGRDTGREAVRQFRISRIAGRITFSTKADGGDYEIPEDFERRVAGARPPWQLGEPDKSARIRVSDRALAAARRDHLSTFSDAGYEGGERVILTHYSEERQLAGWILSLGKEARVLAPQSLVDRVAEGLRKVALAHGAGAQ